MPNRDQQQPLELGANLEQARAMIRAARRRQARDWEIRAGNTRLPLWLRIACYAEARRNQVGHAPMRPGELHAAIDPTLSKPMISRSIGRAVELRWLHPGSTARCLIVPGSDLLAECEAPHRQRATPTESGFVGRGGSVDLRLLP